MPSIGVIEDSIKHRLGGNWEERNACTNNTNGPVSHVSEEHFKPTSVERADQLSMPIRRGVSKTCRNAAEHSD